MLGRLPSSKKNLGAALLSRKAMLETLFRHLDMVRLSVGALVVVALVGCTGLIDGETDGLTPEQRNARAKWANSAFPVLRDNCVVCHNGSRAMVEFLAGGEELEIHDTLMAFEPAVVNIEAPGSSRILSKGLHDGPPLTGEQTSAILLWIQSERDGEASTPSQRPQLATESVVLQLCTAGLPDNPEGTCPTNHISLSTIGPEAMLVPGAEITFTAQGLTSALYLSNLKLNGGTSGTYMEHPLFVSEPAGKEPFPDQIDRFFALKQNTKANTIDQLSGGTAVFNGFIPTDKLAIHFKLVGSFKPDAGGGGGGGGGGGCKVLASFKTNAAPQLQANCAPCHGGGNPNAKSAMDLSGVNSQDDAVALTACNQVRSRINLTTTDQSGFYIAPAVGGTNHPFHFPNDAAFTAFKTPVDMWVQAEKTAP